MLIEATNQARRLSRQNGYPETQEGIDGLVEGIIHACTKHRIGPDVLVTECLCLSPHCPTDYDLMRVAETLRSVEDMKHPPRQAPPKPSACRKCHGTGWHFLYKLKTREGHGDYSFTKEDFITREVYDSFSGGSLDPQKQSVYSEVKPCDCGPSREQMESSAEREERERAGRKWDSEFPAKWAEAIKRVDEKKKNYKSTLQRIVSTALKPEAGTHERKEPGDAEGDRRKEPVSEVVLPFRKKEPA